MQRKCTKVMVFPTEADALKFGGKIPQKMTGTIPTRAYYCSWHRGYHLTSRPKPRPKRRRP